ncbi:MAG: hypothetical protein B6I24_00355 [Bacteroidetes bacterium 4572_128]|nr:MAG: hypothetical protein B6I24_00355 [Bacteroidetes bacterium 4572_128]
MLKFWTNFEKIFFLIEIKKLKNGIRSAFYKKRNNLKIKALWFLFFAKKLFLPYYNERLQKILKFWTNFEKIF